MQDVKTPKKVVKLDPACKDFEANGVKYYKEDLLSINRWKQYLKLQHKLAWGLTFEELFHKVKEAYAFLNKPEPEPVSAGVMLYNVMERIKTIEDEVDTPEILQMCALFLNTEDEDRNIITTAMIKKKVADWTAEGIAIQSFFLFALSTIPGFIPIYEELTRVTSPKTKVETENEEEESQS